MFKVIVFLLLGAHLVSSTSLRHRKLERALAETRIDEEYIVVFREGIDVKSKAAELKGQLPDCQIHFTFQEETIQGVSLGKVSEWQLSELLEDPDVLYVEEVRYQHVFLPDQIQASQISLLLHPGPNCGIVDGTKQPELGIGPLGRCFSSS